MAVVTGANSGIGWHTALELALAGIELFWHPEQRRKGATPWTESDRRFRRQVVAEVFDLASLRPVQSFAARIDTEAKLDLLVNNAGVLSVPTRQAAEDGFELQFGTNFLGLFALTISLMPALMRVPSPKVTTVSSGAAPT